MYPPHGRVAFSTQSGALGLAILDYATRLNIGFSTFATIGNKADVSSNDLLHYWADDPGTDVILLYLESFGNPRKFSDLARDIGRRKPIVAVKAGRSTAGGCPGPLPLTPVRSHRATKSIAGAPLLRGYRGAAAADEKALRDVLLRVSALVDACPNILELDINPLKVLHTGACAIDARIRVGHLTPPSSRRVTY